MSANILCAILTREPSLRDEVKDSLFFSMRHAEQFGHTCRYSRTVEGYGVAIGRNRTVATFMLEPDLTHLMFVDDDVVVPPDAVAELASLDTDIAAGVYVMLHPRGNRIVPLLTARKDGYWVENWFDGPREVDACGTGCMMIRREVFEALGFPWFQWPMWLNEDRKFCCTSDDVDFCTRAKAKGFSIVSHGGIRCGHIKPIDIASVMPGRFKAPPSHFASHVPTLTAIAASFPITTVLEFGAGVHSTPLFLNRDAFPDVESVVSHEHRADWIAKVRSEVDDERLDLRLTPIEAMPSHVVPSDLAFIDCNDGPVDDYSTRRRLLDVCRQCGIVVVHDAERMLETIANAQYRYSYIDSPKRMPHTAVLSNFHDVSVLSQVAEVA